MCLEPHRFLYIGNIEWLAVCLACMKPYMFRRTHGHFNTGRDHKLITTWNIVIFEFVGIDRARGTTVYYVFVVQYKSKSSKFSTYKILNSAQKSEKVFSLAQAALAIQYMYASVGVATMLFVRFQQYVYHEPRECVDTLLGWQYTVTLAIPKAYPGVQKPKFSCRNIGFVSHFASLDLFADLCTSL